jgi:TolB-like protein/DNA-binding winged helix-turn-helix (wHTH) protein/tetratricopeptide (TPR) repeat protein
VSVGESERWQLSDLVIDFGGKVVTRDGAPIALPPLSFKFLQALIEAAPNVLSINDLMDKVWTGVFVNSETVTQRAKLLREALGDDSKLPRYFTARRGMGYQLAATPVRLQAADAPGAISIPRRRFRWRLALASALLAAIGATVGVTLMTSRPHEVASPTMPVRVAVLPFDDLSTDPGDSFIARSIAELVLNRLSAAPGLTIISHESSMLASAANARLAGAALGAAYVVTGSLQRAGGVLRVTCFVVDIARGERLWSERFDWPVDRIYALQDRIADHVAASLEARTGATVKLPPATIGTPNTDAYLAYLKGKSLLGRFTVAETDAAIVQFERAAELDGNFAPALVALYDARMQAADLRKDDPGPVRARYGPLLEKALKLEPGSGEGLFAKAMWSAAPPDERILLFRQAAERDPSNSRGLTAFVELLEWKTRFGDGGAGPEGQRLMDRILSIDPLSPRGRFWAVMRRVGRVTPDETEREQRRELELDPDNYLLANRYATRLWMFHGETAEAVERMEKVIASDPQNPWGAQVAVALYLDVGDLAAARAVAASTPATRDSSTALLAQYVGDWRAAGEAALGPRGFLFNQFTNYGWAEAVRDYALRSGEYDRAARAIAARYDFDLADPKVTYLAQAITAPCLAHILLAKGDRQGGNRLLGRTLAWLDAHYSRFGPSGYLRYRAISMMLLGDEDQALSDLWTSVTTGHDIRQWWYLIDRDPVWAPVRADRRFQRIAAICKQAAAAQRAKLDALRGAGKVPIRATARS